MQPLRSMRMTDEDHYDWLKSRRGLGMPMEEPPEYPPGLCFSIPEQHLEDLDIDDAVPGAVVKFGAMVEATSCHHTEDACRIEASIKMVSIDGGPYVEVDSGPCICLNENDHEKLDLEQGCERGDLLHLIGMARVSTIRDTEYGGKCVELQITDCRVEDESTETEDGDDDAR